MSPPGYVTVTLIADKYKENLRVRPGFSDEGSSRMTVLPALTETG